MKKLICMLFITALAASLLVGCSANYHNGIDELRTIQQEGSDTLVFAQGADPRGLDPALVDDGESAKVIANIYEGLVKFKDGTTEIEPCLAERWEVSEDAKEYTFYLKKGVRFHDGSEFNAEAVKFNIDRQTSVRAVDMPYGKMVWGQVGGTYIVDEYTIKVWLKAPSTPFLTNLAMPLGGSIVSPKTCYSRWFNMNIEPCGTGPYKLLRWEKEDSVILTRNEEYWGEKAVTKNIVFKVIANNEKRVSALINGEADMIDGISSDSLDRMKAAGCRVSILDGMNTNYLSYNTERVKDPEVRKALTEAVNVPELVKTLYGSYAAKATTIVPASISGYSDRVKPYPYKRADAKALLKKKGVKEIHMVTYTNARPYNAATGETLAQLVKGYYEQVGLTVRLDTYDWQGYKEKMAAGAFDVACYGWNGDNKDPNNYLDVFTLEDWHLNVSRYWNVGYNELARKAVETANGDKRAAIYEKMEKQLSKEAVVLPLSHAKVIVASSDKISQMKYSSNGIIYLKNVKKAAH